MMKKSLQQQKQQILLFESCICRICVKIFEDPRILRGCSHTFCWKCIKQISTSSNSNTTTTTTTTQTTSNSNSNSSNSNKNSQNKEEEEENKRGGGEDKRGGEEEEDKGGEEELTTKTTVVICPECQITSNLQPKPLKNYIVRSYCEFLNSPTSFSTSCLSSSSSSSPSTPSIPSPPTPSTYSSSNSCTSQLQSSSSRIQHYNCCENWR